MREIKIKLSEAAREVLSRSRITPTSVELPEQIDRKLYLEIDKVFKAAGGKWNRGRGVHLFNQDPREVLGLAVEVGAIVDTKKTMQQFFTPAAVADLMVVRAELRIGLRVLEPSAGSGLLLDALDRVSFVDECVAVEFDATLAARLVARAVECGWSGGAVLHEDFLLCAPAKLGEFDRVLMNPPFREGQGIIHIQHALRFLKPGGRLVAICPDGPRENETLKPIATTWELLPAGTFRESGTDVRTALLTVQK